ncbi:MAG: hydantoinase B/oxoprolinase family protein [Anaerolineae bacterium]|nr:hydantoinase B/oxoprolinase family protein [Anaerolineae bacterium]NUQ04874.1 hydantoinase B/oxoprolinase family protein [Anaerolineae bacterium]
MTVDAISLEVFKNLFVSAAEEMGVALRRAAFSPNIRERLDFSCAVFDAAGAMIAQAAHIPVHLGSMPASVRAALDRFPDFAPGDVIIVNDPYHGGTHLPDVTLVSGIFEGGAPLFFVASRAHHADVGGMSPGSLPLSTELYQEGVIIPPIRLFEGGRRHDGVLALITANSRAPHERIGDLEAQIAAHRVGEARLRGLIAAHGVARLSEHAAALIAYTRRMTEAAIAALPDGVYTFEDALEGDGQASFRIPIRAAVIVQGSRLTVDFSGTAAQVAGNVNAVTPIAVSAVGYCVRLLSGEDLPVNAGCFDPVTVIAPEGCLLNPRFPAAVAVGNTETGQRVVDVVLGALAQALPECLPAAAQGSMNNITIGAMVGGVQRVYYETIGGGHGASADGAGLSGRHSHMTNTLNTPVEALEAAYPIRVWAYALRDDSGGAGRHRGGDGIRREYELTAPGVVTLNCERREIAPYGSAGGADGAMGVNTVIRAGEAERVPAKWTGRLEAGDRLVIETPGGGGWGGPIC